MTGGGGQEVPARAQAVRDRVDLVALVGASVKLGRGRNPRGKCPFHGSKSDSLAVYPDSGRAKCWGCGWSGDAIGFVKDLFGLDFMEALKRLEDEHGLRGLQAAPVARPRAPVQSRPRGSSAPVSNEEWARFVWRQRIRDRAPVRRWFVARGVPAAVLTDARLADVWFAPMVPVMPWGANEDPRAVPNAPAIIAQIRRRQWNGEVDEFPSCGLHLTFLSPDGTAKMARKRRDGTDMPARKMVGTSGRAFVLLGRPERRLPLVVGEGLETTLSGIALLTEADAAMPEVSAEAVGVAVLSLDNLQGSPKKWKRDVLPLFAIEPDPDRRGVAWGGTGPVTILIDADMKPLAGPIDRDTGAPRGFPIVEARGGPIVQRGLTSIERSEICATLAVANWRAAGRSQVKAVRPPMGQDFNDAVRRETDVAA